MKYYFWFHILCSFVSIILIVYTYYKYDNDCEIKEVVNAVWITVFIGWIALAIILGHIFYKKRK